MAPPSSSNRRAQDGHRVYTAIRGDLECVARCHSRDMSSEICAPEFSGGRRFYRVSSPLVLPCFGDPLLVLRRQLTPCNLVSLQASARARGCTDPGRYLQAWARPAAEQGRRCRSCSRRSEEGDAAGACKAPDAESAEQDECGTAHLPALERQSGHGLHPRLSVAVADPALALLETL